MKFFRRLLLLVVFSVPMLTGCSSSGDDNPSPATFGAATFDNSTWN